MSKQNKTKSNIFYLVWRQLSMNSIEKTNELGVRYCFEANYEKDGRLTTKVGKFSAKKMVENMAGSYAIFNIGNNENDIWEAKSYAEMMIDKGINVVLYIPNFVRKMETPARAELFFKWFNEFENMPVSIGVYGFPSWQYREFLQFYAKTGKIFPFTQSSVLERSEHGSELNPNCEPGLAQEKSIQKIKSLIFSGGKEADAFPWNSRENRFEKPTFTNEFQPKFGMGLSIMGEPWNGFTFESSIRDQIEASNLVGVNEFLLNSGESLTPEKEEVIKKLASK